MALTASEVRVAGTGHVYLAPSGTTLPTNVATALNAGFIDLGYCTEDGVDLTFGRETKMIDSWQADSIRNITLKQPVGIGFTLMQVNKNTLTAALGGGTGAGATTEYTFTPAADGVNTEGVMVIEFVDGSLTYRWLFHRVILDGELKVNFKRDVAVDLPVKFNVLANTPKWKIFSNDTVLG